MAIVSVLVFLCIFPGQHLITHLLPGISGLVSIDPSLTIMDIPVHMPLMIDMILVPGLFILLYVVVILLYPSRAGMSSWREVLQRAGAVVAGAFALLLCLSLGALISYLVKGYLPPSIKNGMDSFAINADIHLSYTGSKIIPLHGNIISLICFIIGAAIFIHKIKKAPRVRKVTRLTREQRMTPYERMLREKKASLNAPAPDIKPASPLSDHKSLSALCRNHPLLTIRPEAVNYRPLE